MAGLDDADKMAATFVGSAISSRYMSDRRRQLPISRLAIAGADGPASLMQKEDARV
jgi:hypothetical protein